MYENNIYVTLFFAFMWLAVVGGSVTSTQGVTLIPLGPTNYCTNGKLDAYVIASGIIPLVNDTLVFIAITWRLIHGSPNARLSARTGGMWPLFFGNHLPAFSRGENAVILTSSISGAQLASFGNRDPGYHADKRHGLSRISKYKVRHIQREDW